MVNQLRLFEENIPSMATLDVKRCKVKVINYKTAANMVEKFHYAHRIPNIKFSYGLYVENILAGCITYGMPTSSKVGSSICGEKYKNKVYELNRLFVFDWCGKNTESWLIGQSFKLLPKFLILVSYSDVGQNHVGYIYQATNWMYTGLSDKSGCFSRIEINGKERTSKSFYDELGTQSKNIIQKNYPNAIFHEYTQKHRYVYFLGSKSQKKTLKKALNYDILPYPKLTYDNI